MTEDLTPGQTELLAEPAAKNADEPKESPKGTEYSGKFSQFKTVEDLETSFAASFKEAKRLNEKISALEAEKATQKAEPKEEKPDDAAAKLAALEEKLTLLEGKMGQQETKQRLDDEAQFNAWMAEHPEVKDNEPLIEDLVDELESVARKAAKKGQALTMKDGLDRAWTKLDPHRDSEAEGATKAIAKEMAASAAPSGNAPGTTTKKTLTEDERKTAKIYGLKPEEYADFKL